MPSRDLPTRYGTVAQTFHWLIAALIVTQFTLAYLADDLPLGIHKLALLARHKSAGMTPLQRSLAQTTHIALYVLLFAMPLTGWLMSSAKNYSVSWFGLFTWPNLIAKNETAFDLLRSTHHILSYALFAIAVLHLLAALKHHFWDKDTVLLRMLPFVKSDTAKLPTAKSEKRL
jgi:cytochrome b561